MRFLIYKTEAMLEEKMINEKNMVYEIDIDVADLNEYNKLKPSGYMRLINKVIEIHLNKLKYNVEMTMTYNLAWVLVSLSLEIDKPVTGLQTLKARTWHSERKGPFFRREFQFRDEDENLIFRGSTFSVLLDVEKRAVFRKKELPFKLMATGGENTIEARPSCKMNLGFVPVNERKVYNSHIDRLGHVNNIRYGEYVYDEFNDKEKESLGELRRMEMYFAKELRFNDRFQILKAADNGQLIFKCININTGDNSFNAVFYLK